MLVDGILRERAEEEERSEVERNSDRYAANRSAAAVSSALYGTSGTRWSRRRAQWSVDGPWRPSATTSRP
jgi:hypothetical protein